MIADGMEDTAADNSRDELFQEEEEETTADGSEVEVVDQEQGLELESRTVAHPFTSTKDDAVVNDDEDGGRLEGRHGSFEGDELELADGRAHDGSPRLIEEAP